MRHQGSKGGISQASSLSGFNPDLLQRCKQKPSCLECSASASSASLNAISPPELTLTLSNAFTPERLLSAQVKKRQQLMQGCEMGAL